ncbi:response regulator [Paenibacillus sp. HB172176]|uniref:response regulator n=1 Tax=Paenibacillus sp. HB172176 TaxID=2493690 RepID=UPI00143B1EFF|nr:response regulator [Paenibacillus sp. HB172176]
MIKVLIVDDEPAMLAVMKRKLRRIHDVVVAGSCRNAAQTLEWISRDSADLIFIDIKIAEDNGLDLARRIRDIDGAVDLVFVTSHSEYAMDSFEAYPLDYIVKPVSQSRLERTIVRAVSRRSEAARAEKEEAMACKLQIRGLGGLEVSGRNGMVKWVSRKSAELFAYLLLQRGRETPRSRIIEDVFPDMPIDNANRYLNTAVYQLRKMLQSQVESEVVLSSREEYSLAMERIDADFIAFERCAALSGEWDESELEESMHWESRYAGELFEGKSYLWAVGERARLDELYAVFAKRMIRNLLRVGRKEEASVVAQRLALRYELDEEANALLLRVYRELNDITALRKHYQRFAEHYRQEIGVPVPSEFAELYQQWLPHNGIEV